MTRISRAYPFVEWGVLYSRDRAGVDNRYPALAWLERFATKAEEQCLNTALHLCGAVVRELLAEADTGEFTQEGQALLQLAAKFGRVQLNTHAKLKQVPGLKALMRILGESGTRVILQWNAHNAPVCLELSAQPDFDVLVDDSGGRGVSREDWPQLSPSDIRRPGFAGGLGPDNFSAELARIDAAATSRAFWVDMEGKLRDSEDHFDLDRCEDVLAQAVAFRDAHRKRARHAFGARSHNVRTLTGARLNWWVGRALGLSDDMVAPYVECCVMLLNRHLGQFDRFAPTENLKVALRALRQERVSLMPLANGNWLADFGDAGLRMEARDVETAGLRAVVAKHFGAKVPADIFGARELG